MRSIYLVWVLLCTLSVSACTHSGRSGNESAHDGHGEEAEHRHDHNHPAPEHNHSANENNPSTTRGETTDHDHQESHNPGSHKVSPEPGSGEHQHAASGDDHEGTYHIETIQPTTFHEVVRASGELLSMKKNETTLVAPASGIVELADATILEGKPVENGQVLFYISGNGVAEGNPSVKLKKTKAAFDQARTSYEQAAELFIDSLITQKEFLDRKTEFSNARAEYGIMKAYFSGNLGAVKSPKKGWLQDVLVGEGDHVRAGQKMATVMRGDKMLLKAEVSQRYASRMDDFVAARFQTPDGRVYSTQDLNGDIIARGKAFSSQSYYIPLYFEMDNRPEFIPGSFVNVFLLGEKKEGVIALSREAFIEEQGNFFVFVEQEGNLVKRAVETGISDGESMLVEEGIQPGERVVTRGAYQVKVSRSSSSIPHGHSH